MELKMLCTWLLSIYASWSTIQAGVCPRQQLDKVWSGMQVVGLMQCVPCRCCSSCAASPPPPNPEFPP
eukprot:1143157-Pelagomonas_calceolata.AAC.1